MLQGKMLVVAGMEKMQWWKFGVVAPKLRLLNLRGAIAGLLPCSPPAPSARGDALHGDQADGAGAPCNCRGTR